MALNSKTEEQNNQSKMKELIDQVRERFIEDCEQNAELYDPIDIDIIRNDDWQVERFIKRKRTVDDSVEMIKSTLKWRHKLQLPVLKDSDFPEEFFKIGAVFGYAKDKQGNGVVYMRVRLNRKIKEIDDKIKQFIMYTMNKVDVETGGKGMAIVFDCKNAGIANVDMDTLWFLVDSLIKYYPYGMSYILVYDMPWILSSAWSIVKGWLPSEHRNLIKFATKDQIFDYIDKENLPMFLGGSCPINYHHVPKECRPAEEFAPEHGLTEKDVNKIFKVFKPYLEEADEEIKMLTQVN